ncbi:MAG: hypothetical protein H5T62_07285 [Anaerolineae bacterium]|nr:hypothetical protein [Anaerolineae bacterium]
MERSPFRHRLPGYIAMALAILTTSLWTLWGIAEMYYEGWGLPFPQPLVYLIPGVTCLAFTLVALTWPQIGGWLIIVIGGAFTAWWWSLAAARGGLSWEWILSTFPVSSLLILIGLLFLLEGRYRRQRRAAGWAPPQPWLRRNLRYVLAVGIPLLIVIGVSAYYAPLILTRVDDGDRGARLIEGRGVTLVWAPKGPGWNWKQSWGGYPSWDMIALYGVPPVGFGDKPGYENQYATAEDMQTTGLCRYLSEDGTTLLTEPQDIWRMPTTDEIVRSLVRGGENAGCLWDGESDKAVCERQPNKETPLWAPDEEPIYYWSADEYDEREAYYVSYNGWIGQQAKDWGNPRHGYRCVREPMPRR